MKKYLIILIFQLLVANDIMKYEVSLYKMPMAEVIINYESTFFQNKKAINLTFKTHTNKFASKIFKVNNDYETIIDPNNFNILSFKKNTYQTGLSNQLHTINNGDNVIYANTDIIIPENYFNIFSLLYYLTITPFEEVQTNIKLEREALLYDCIIKKNKTESFYEYELIFDLINKQQVPIIENTDMFTWAVFKENSYKKIIVGKNKKIKSCVFSVGLTSLRANLK